jgi:hypothetical protein
LPIGSAEAKPYAIDLSIYQKRTLPEKAWRHKTLQISQWILVIAGIPQLSQSVQVAGNPGHAAGSKMLSDPRVIRCIALCDEPLFFLCIISGVAKCSIVDSAHGASECSFRCYGLAIAAHKSFCQIEVFSPIK